MAIFNEILNNIANIALLTNETNSSRIKAKNPSVYIKDILTDYDQKGKIKLFYEIMDSQFIDKKMVQLLLNDDFDNFIYSRTQLLVNHIDRLCDIN